MSNTPRTDMLTSKWDDDGASRGSAYMELAELARNLESELTALRAQVADLERQLGELRSGKTWDVAFDAGITKGRAELQAKLDEYIPVINMLVLCPESECREIESYPLKLRAILDAMIAYRRKLDEAAKQEPVAYLWPAVGNHRASIHWPAEIAHDASIRNVAQPLYRLRPNTEAMIERAREEEREACAKVCEEVVTYPAGHNGQLEGYGPVKKPRDGKGCAAAIRARKP